jgi:hypothetical protein
MIIVRNVFVAKPGNASKLAAQMKEAAAVGKMNNVRVLTDITGEFNRVILEHQVANLSEFEGQFQQNMADEAFKAKMKGYTDLYITGHREILKVM